MALHIGGIVELVRPDDATIMSFGQFGRQCFGVANIIARIFIGLGRYQSQIGTTNTQCVLFFLALGFWHNNYRPIAFGVADNCQANASVTCSAFNNETAGTKFTACFRIFNDGQGRPIFDRAARIHEFRFAINVTAGLLGYSAQFDQRCVANGTEKVTSHLVHPIF